MKAWVLEAAASVRRPVKESFMVFDVFEEMEWWQTDESF